jgi:hypothetical protein
MDNLIRAKNGLPIVHIDYERITGTVTESSTEDIRGSYTDVVRGAITRMVAAAFTGKQDKQLGVTGTPVRDKPGIYLAYLEYLKLENGLMKTTQPPPRGAAHICRLYCGSYYWIPSDHSGDFFKLSMRVSGLRDNVLQPPAYYDLTIRGVVSVNPPPPEESVAPTLGSQHEFVVELAQPLPKNDRGTASVVVDGKVLPLSFIQGPGPDGEPTSRLKIEFTYGPDIAAGQLPIHPKRLEKGLAGQSIKFYPARFTPEPPKRDQLLEEIRDELNAIRLDGLRNPR